MHRPLCNSCIHEPVCENKKMKPSRHCTHYKRTDVISYIDGLIDGAQAIRPQGKWIYIYPLTYECSICRGDALDVNDYPYQSNFCPHCGADMREGEDNGKK